MTPFDPLAPLLDHLDRISRQEDGHELSRAIWRYAPSAAQLLRHGTDPITTAGPAAADLARRFTASDTGLYPRPWLDAPGRTFEGLFTRAVHDLHALRELWRLLLAGTTLASPPALDPGSRLHLALAIDSLLGDLLRYEAIHLYPHGQPVERPLPLAAARARQLIARVRATLDPSAARSLP